MVEYGNIQQRGKKGMALIRCPECEKEVSEKAISCPNCGYVFEKMKFCKFCGSRIPIDSVVCVKCGRQVENAGSGADGITINNVSNASSSASASSTQQSVRKEREKKEVNRITALLLCIFLGYFGAHKFYEGNVGMGVLYMFTFGLFGVGWIVDIFIILGKPNPYYV